MNGNIIGISDHGGWAVLVTVGPDGALLDRRRVELVDEMLPSLPHHHEGQLLPIDAAVALVEQVRISAERHAALALDAVAMAVPGIRGVALRACQPLPPTIAERIKDYRARNVADWVMYRKAFASAAESRGLTVHWYDAKKVLGLAGQALQAENIDTCDGVELIRNAVHFAHNGGTDGRRQTHTRRRFAAHRGLTGSRCGPRDRRREYGICRGQQEAVPLSGQAGLTRQKMLGMPLLQKAVGVRCRDGKNQPRRVVHRLGQAIDLHGAATKRSAA